MRMQREREAIIEACLRMEADDLTVGTSGNVSIRDGDVVAITPSGVPYRDLTPADVVLIDLDGTVVEGDLKPSSEVPMHTVVYRETDATAVVHTHPIHATTVGLLVDELPAVHYMLTILGGPVRVTPYRPFATRELAEASAEVLRDRGGVILGNHGATTIGSDLDEAYTRSEYLEWCARLWCTASGIGTPRLLSDEQMEAAVRNLSSYGQ